MTQKTCVQQEKDIRKRDKKKLKIPVKNLKVVHPLRAHAQPTADGRMIILVLAHKTPRIRSHRRCRWMLSEKR
jgi:hypothetical protein